MTTVRLSEGDVDVAAWATRTRARFTALYRDMGETADASAVLAHGFVSQWVSDAGLTSPLKLLEFSGAARGCVLVGEIDDRGTPTLAVLDLDGDFDVGAEAAVHAALVSEATTRGGRQCRMVVPGNSPRAQAVARSGGHTLVATRMRLMLPSAPASPSPLSFDPMTDAEFQTFYDHLIESYAADMAAAGAVDPDAARTHSVAQTSSLLPDGRVTAGHHFVTARAGEPVGLLWLFVGPDPAGTRGFVYDVEVHAAHRGKRYGRAIMEEGSVIATREGALSIGLNVFGFNDVAIALYRSMGYEVETEMYTLTA